MIAITFTKCTPHGVNVSEALETYLNSIFGVPSDAEDSIKVYNGFVLFPTDEFNILFPDNFVINEELINILKHMLSCCGDYCIQTYYPKKEE